MSTTQLDAFVQRLQNMHPWDIYQITEAGTVEPWYTVTGAVVDDLVLREHDLLTQVQIIPAQIAHWGRMKALAFRVWQIEARLLRAWKAQQFLRLYAPEDPPKGWKKPSQAQVDAEIRIMVEYSMHYRRVERAEEAYNATDMVLSAFRAKKDMLKDYVLKQQNDKAPMMDII